MYLSILGYSIVATIAAMTGMTYQQTWKNISGIKEIIYTNGSHYVVKLTEEPGQLVEKISIEMY